PFSQTDGLPAGAVQLIDCTPDGRARAFVSGAWYQLHGGRWEMELRPRAEQEFVFVDSKGDPIEAPIPWGEVRQFVRYGTTNFLVTTSAVFAVINGKMNSLHWPASARLNQIAL